MLSYLWSFSKFRETNWGVKNLEFMLLLANDLQELEMIDILLEPKPFSNVLSPLPFPMAMDFIEDHIINNNVISEEQKLKLLNSEELMVYSFVGAFIHYSSMLEND